MGLFSTLGNQFVSVIDWVENDNETLAVRYPMADRLIQTTSQLTVRESQAALFVNEGHVADLFGPGRYELTTRNLPILTMLKNWDKAFNSPYKSDVYFFSLREHTNQKWGTPQPIVFRDSEMGPIRLRTFGTYSYQLTDATLFYKKLSGTREIFKTADVEGQLRAAIMTSIASLLGKGQTPFIEMAGNQTAFSETLKKAITPNFAEYGLTLSSFFVESITLPEELQTYFDKAAQVRMVGDLGRYTQFQAAESLSAAAASSGGAAGAGVGLGAGVALGQTMAAALGASLGGGGSAAKEDPMQTIEKLHDLMKKGILSEAEFTQKKTEILKKI